MPKKKTGDDSVEFRRMWCLLQALETEPSFKTVRDLKSTLETEGLDATERTIQRIMQFFELWFSLKQQRRWSEQGRPCEWAWPRETGRPTIGNMEPATAVAYEIVEQLSASVLPESIRQSLEPDFKRARKVLAQSGEKAVKLSKKIRILPRGIGRLPAEIHPKVLGDVYEALMLNCKLAVDYQKASGTAHEDKHYELNPLGLVTRFDTLYLIHALDPEDEGRDPNKVMEWPLHRIIRTWVMGNDAVRVPNGFNLDEHIKSMDFFGNPQTTDFKRLGPTFKLKILANPHTARYIQERPFGQDQSIAKKPTADGRIKIEATVNNTRELLSQLHDFGADIEVLAPKIYRDYFIKLSEALSAQYL